MSANEIEVLLKQQFDALLNKLPPNMSKLLQNKENLVLDLAKEMMQTLQNDPQNQKMLLSDLCQKAIMTVSCDLAVLKPDQLNQLNRLILGEKLDAADLKDLKNGLSQLFKLTLTRRNNQRKNPDDEEEIKNQAEALAEEWIEKIRELNEANNLEASKDAGNNLLASLVSVTMFVCALPPDDIGDSQEQTFIEKGLNPALVTSKATNPFDLTFGDPSGQQKNALEAYISKGGALSGTIAQQIVDENLLPPLSKTPQLGMQ